jgi:AcrR family transcriptional regulator
MPPAQRQASILRGAAEAFSRTGFAGTSMEEIAAASGITKLIVYRHFGSKEELYRAVLDRAFRLLVDELKQARERSEQAARVRTLLRVGRSWPAGVRLLLLHAPREPEFSEYAAKIRARVVRSLQERLRLRDPALRRLCAELCVSYVFDAVLTWLDLGPPERDEQFIACSQAGLAKMLQEWRKTEDPPAR